VIGPRSEYLVLGGDLNGDGLSDLGLKSLWTDKPTRVVWTSATTDGNPYTVTPLAACNRMGFKLVICHPDIVRRANRGEAMGVYDHRPDSKWLACTAVLDMTTLGVRTYPAKHAWRWQHMGWSGDGEYIHMAGYSWRCGADAPSVPIRIGDSPCSNHYGTGGGSGRYIPGDSGRDSMERLEMTDIWTGEMRTIAHISTTTEPPGRIGQDHGHPASSPDGTKVLVHSCYDLVNHRLYAVPAKDVRAGDSIIPVATTEGFAAKGQLLVGCGGSRWPRMAVSYERTDATHFYGCDWGENAEERLMGTFYGNARKKVLPKGSHFITDARGRLFPDGSRRPRKEYIVVVKQPDPPRALSATRMGEGQRVRLTWQPSACRKEIAGYVVYRRSGAEPIQRLTPECIASCEYVDTAPPPNGKLTYVVRAVEHCGLYGAHSSAAWVDAGRVGVHLVDSYDVRGCNYVAPGEPRTTDRRSTRVRIPVAGDYVLWARGRVWQETETLHIRVDGIPMPDVQVQGAKWHWLKLGSCPLSAGEHVIELVREENLHLEEGNLVKNPGFEDGLEAWAFDQDVISVDSTRARSGDRCVKLSGMLTGKKLRQVIEVDVRPEWYYRLSFWMRGKITKGYLRYGGRHTLGRMYPVLSPLPYPRGWVRAGNEWDDSRWHQMEYVYANRPLEPGKPPGANIAVQPVLFAWGEHVGTVYIDDVCVTELGPRLRPVKVTKLLVTNVEGHQPKGLDGREAYPFSQAPLIAVTGLRQTERMGNTVTLEWDAGRAGTRGYNIYANAGADCPTTKYFRSTSVWGKTSVTLHGLPRATSFTVKVTAINEDGIEGPAVSVQASTSTVAAETHVLEAERAALTLPVRVEKQGGVTFVVSPADRTRMDELYDLDGSGTPTGAAKFELGIKERGPYAIWGRLFAPDGGSNSLWFSLDGQTETAWGVPAAAFDKWSWIAPVDGKLWDLKPGRHTITIRTREAGTRLDRIVVTNDLGPRKLSTR